MRLPFRALPLALLTAVLALTPALAQEAGVQAGLDAFSALPDTAVTSHFDLTEIDFTKEVPSDYRLGAGDIIIIDLGNPAGDMSQQVISPQGDIFVPVVGKLQVSGLTAPEVAGTLQEEMEAYYRNIHLAVTVGRVRKMEVQLTGMVQSPGTYLAFGGTSLSHFVQLVNQRFEASPVNIGIDPNILQARLNNRFRVLLPEGSYRRVKVYRGGELLKEVDLARLLIFGDMGQEVLLQHGDRVHIPAIEQYVVFDASVPFAGKMELLPGDKLPELVKLAGGPDNWAIDQTVQIQQGPGNEGQFFHVRLR
ncbi:MAG TPA: polysaccharide biosynthesis/export family protein, partial [bacterium]|nr:polysaccharide biosynthesis/export family protein [bacterium]